MATPTDATAADKLKLMSLKKEVMASVLSAGVRVNDSALRKKGEDKVAAMLAAVKGKSSAAPEPAAADDDAKIELFS